MNHPPEPTFSCIVHPFLLFSDGSRLKLPEGFVAQLLNSVPDRQDSVLLFLTGTKPYDEDPIRPYRQWGITFPLIPRPDKSVIAEKLAYAADQLAAL